MGGRLLLGSAVLAVLLGGGGPGLAASGVGEIHHVCAVRTGCLPGDAPGYPVTIDGSAGHSYRLTSDLVVPDENTDGILVTAAGVSIDLGGFEIVRAACVQARVSCRPSSGSGSGVRVEPADLPGVSVTGGTVTGMGDAGLWLGRQARVEEVRARWNRGFGVRVGRDSLVIDSAAQENGQGILALDGSVVSGNTAIGNAAGDGIEVLGRGAVVHGNAASHNAVRGIEVGEGSTVEENLVHGNGAGGIAAPSGCGLLGNTVSANGGDGIAADSGSSVQRNAIRGNAGWGIRFTASPPAPPAAYRENTIAANGSGSVTGHGVELGGNVCDGTASCP